VSQTVIQVQDLGKRYLIGRRERYLALRDVLTDALKNPFRRRPSPNYIWALKDVSFEVKRGEVLGLIGRNGAGKTTLLKILARVTRPTAGYVEIRGRVGSLLEVGTGFHPELTGRENVYLSGAILGMSKREIESKFDAIVTFAEVARFIDTPLKHYSSGMQMRLAFAVAAHLDPEILLVDEVLAVGDLAFQKKCMGKMSDVAKHGRTIVFVSHNLAAITNLCGRALWLNRGEVTSDGLATETVDKYISQVMRIAATTPLSERTDREGNGRIRFVELHWETLSGQVVPTLRSGEDYKLVLTYECPDGMPKNRALVCFGIKDHSGIFLILHQTNFTNQSFEEIPSRGHFICRIPRFPLAAGEYSFNLFVGTGDEACDSIEDGAMLTVEPGDFFGTGYPGRPALCRVLTECKWELGE
jgi:lipopolysaccharide transport system ATP-binding protein